MDDNRLHSWLQWLAAERLKKNRTRCMDKVKRLRYELGRSLLAGVARNFGHRVNADAFERIAASLPINIMIRHSNSIVQLEALLLGQAGLLTN